MEFDDARCMQLSSLGSTHDELLGNGQLVSWFYDKLTEHLPEVCDKLTSDVGHPLFKYRPK